jgi:AAA family ATP:ADP antiporter
VLILTVIGTFIYFTRLQMVAALGEDLDMRTGAFARLDLYTQVTTLVLQAVVAGHLMKRLGVHVTLALLPLTVVLGFVGLAITASLVMLVSCRPRPSAPCSAPSPVRRARHLFTVVPREDKYKSKGVHRHVRLPRRDVVGAPAGRTARPLAAGLGALVAVTIPLALVWGALGIWLGPYTAAARHRTAHPPWRPRRAPTS